MNGGRTSEILDRGTLLGQVFTPVRGTASLLLQNVFLIYRGRPSNEYAPRLCSRHHGPGIVAATSFEAVLLVPEPTVVTI